MTGERKNSLSKPLFCVALCAVSPGRISEAELEELLIDVTEQPIERPVRKQKKYLALLSFEWVNSVNQWRQIHVLLGKKKA